MKPKNIKKINRERREITLTVRVNSEEMRAILARAHAYANGNVSAWLRYVATGGK